jgi:hypothetical protein
LIGEADGGVDLEGGDHDLGQVAEGYGGTAEGADGVPAGLVADVQEDVNERTDEDGDSAVGLLEHSDVGAGFRVRAGPGAVVARLGAALTGEASLLGACGVVHETEGRVRHGVGGTASAVGLDESALDFAGHGNASKK